DGLEFIELALASLRLLRIRRPLFNPSSLQEVVSETAVAGECSGLRLGREHDNAVDNDMEATVVRHRTGALLDREAYRSYFLSEHPTRPFKLGIRLTSRMTCKWSDRENPANESCPAAG